MADPLTNRFEEALVFAFRLHKDQLRKQSQIPYISHLLAVTALVLENGGSENQAIAALLHDAVEDQGGYDTLQDIKSRFGEEVACIVDGCTDAYLKPKPDWKERKIDYLEKIKYADDTVLLVSLADKVHNARSILKDLQSNEKNVWDKFNGGKDGTLWYYQSLAEIFKSCSYHELATELNQIIEKIIKLSD
ncbi:MAG: HD domain-containing protein [Anaerolineales bacterium]|nr:HD domain-containing protein [Anaerolineales bacterium]